MDNRKSTRCLDQMYVTSVSKYRLVFLSSTVSDDRVFSYDCLSSLKPVFGGSKAALYLDA
jgi:hypothetical protein